MKREKSGNASATGRLRVLLFLVVIACIASFAIPDITMAKYRSQASGSQSISTAAFDVRITAPFSGTSTRAFINGASNAYSYTVTNNGQVRIRVRAVVMKGSANLSTTAWVTVDIGSSTTITVTVPSASGNGNSATVLFEYEQVD